MSKTFSNTDTSKQTAEMFLDACSTEEIDRILAGRDEFQFSKNWVPYGRAEQNWDRVGVQTSEPVGAFAEIIINSIDAILTRKAIEKGIHLRGCQTPSNMTEAVKEFFPEVQEGRLTLLSQDQRTKLAENCVLVGIKRADRTSYKYPTYTIVDFGEGQNHADFEKTFLSLGEKNKEGIPFVQGRFNMGSTGSITFCTRADIRKGMYKFVLSKRAVNNSDGLWGWTLIRVRGPRKGEDLPVVEYFCPDGEIAYFESAKIKAFGREDIGVLNGGGSIVKMYEYDIGPGARAVDFGLHDALTTSLIDCALPVRLYDFDAKPTKSKLRAEGIASRTFAGMKAVLRSGSNESDVEIEGSAINSENPSVGTIRIFYYGLNLKEYLKSSSHRIFYTLNGQSQAKDRASVLRKAHLDDLRNHLIVQVDCNEMDSTARSVIFKPDRERMADTEITRELKEMVIETLKENGDLRAYAREIRRQRVADQIKDQTNKEFLADLIKNSPDLQELFDMGTVVYQPTQDSGGDTDFEGKRFPTILKPLNLESGEVKSIPINTYRRIECQTDAQNDYLTRENDRGEFVSLAQGNLPNSATLRNGKLHIKVLPPESASEGDIIPATFGFSDPSRAEPLSFGVNIKITAKEDTKSSKSGKARGTKRTPRPSKEFPDFLWVKKEEWDDHMFNEESGAYVSQGDTLVVYVNKDNKYLIGLSAREADKERREIIRLRFRYGVGLLTLAMYKKLVRDSEQSDEQENYDGDSALRVASSAISAHVVTLIERFGGDK